MNDFESIEQIVLDGLIAGAQCAWRLLSARIWFDIPIYGYLIVAILGAICINGLLVNHSAEGAYSSLNMAYRRKAKKNMNNLIDEHMKNDEG